MSRVDPSSPTLQLFVVRRGLDPTAWTALHTLHGTHPAWRIEAMARAEFWEFAWDGGGSGSETKLRQWVEGSNWFANPTRDRLLWRPAETPSPPLASHAVHEDGRVGASGPGAFLLVVWRQGMEAAEHATLARQALSESVTIRRGTVWWMGAAQDALAEAGGTAGGGLLANPESQWHGWWPDGFPQPALGADVEAALVRGAAKGAA